MSDSNPKISSSDEKTTTAVFNTEEEKIETIQANMLEPAEGAEIPDSKKETKGHTLTETDNLQKSEKKNGSDFEGASAANKREDEESGPPSVRMEELAAIVKSPSQDLSSAQTFSLKSGASEKDDNKKEPEENKLDELEEMSTERSYQSLQEMALTKRYSDSSIRPEDFTADKPLEGFTDFIPSPTSSTVSPVSSMSTVSEEGEEVEEQVKIDRNIYYELYALYIKQQRIEKRKNNFFQSKVVDYYKKRRMYHVLVTDQTDLADHQKKYDELLDELEQVSEQSAREQEAMQEEVQSLKHKCHSREEDLNLLFENLQKHEDEVCKGLLGTSDEASKINVEKAVERFLRRQRLETANLTKMRLAYIKLTNKYNETQETLDSLDNLGPNLRLIDYEQLKSDNRNLSDKLEEREMSLTNIRTQCQNVMQILAHTREKLAAVETETENQKETLGMVTDECLDAREQMTTLKLERDETRRLTSKLKEDVGLLTKHQLLRDMERAKKEVDEGRAKLNEYKNGYAAAHQNLVAVRAKMNKIISEQKSSKEEDLKGGSGLGSNSTKSNSTKSNSTKSNSTGSNSNV